MQPPRSVTLHHEAPGDGRATFGAGGFRRTGEVTLVPVTGELVGGRHTARIPTHGEPLPCSSPLNGISVSHRGPRRRGRGRGAPGGAEAAPREARRAPRRWWPSPATSRSGCPDDTRINASDLRVG